MLASGVVYTTPKAKETHPLGILHTSLESTLRKAVRLSGYVVWQVPTRYRVQTSVLPAMEWPWTSH
jgi:hypothetical protein